MSLLTDALLAVAANATAGPTGLVVVPLVNAAYGYLAPKDVLLPEESESPLASMRSTTFVVSAFAVTIMGTLAVAMVAEALSRPREA